MLPPIWDSTTKLENVSQYATLLEYSAAKLLQKSEMRKDIVIELSYKGFS